MTVARRLLAALSVAVGLAGWGSTAHADWAACQRQLTRTCLLEEALRGDGAPLTGKDRLEVLIWAGAAMHPEYATDADIDEAVREVKSAPTGAKYEHISLAIQGLVAGHRTQQAGDLTASLSLRGGAYAAFFEFTRALAKLGDLDTTAALLKRMPPLEPNSSSFLGNLRVVVSVETLAGAGKIEDALAFMTSALGHTPLRNSDLARMHIVVARAYADRGDAAAAQRFFDLAREDLEKDLGYSWLAADARASLLSVAAFRGDVESVRAGLQHLPTDGTADIRVYPKVVPALVQAKQFALALEIAKSAPASVRDWMLATVSAGNAANGRIDDARAVLTLLSDKAGAERRVAVVRSIAAAMVKTGKVAAAVEMAGEVSDPKGRKAVLFTLAQELPQ